MAMHSSFPDISIPEVDLWAFLFDRNDRGFSDQQVIFIDAVTNRSHTFAQLKEKSIAFGNGLKSSWNWSASDVMAIYAPNSVDTAIIAFGCLWAGGIVTMVNPLYTADELAFQLKDSGAKAIVTHSQMLKTTLSAAKDLDILPAKILLLGELGESKGVSVRHFSIIQSHKADYPRIKPSPDSLAFLLYTSGTTGLPKGAMLCHRNMIANILQLKASEGAQLKSGQDKMLAAVPLFHIYGLTTLLLQAIYYGVETLIMQKFDLVRFCETIQDRKVTYTYIIPPIVLLLAKHPAVARFDISSLRMINSAAAPLSRDLILKVWTRLAIPVKQGYGLTETSPCIHAQIWDEWKSTAGSIGKLVPGMEAMIVGPDGKKVPIGQSGELLVKGPNVFKGYLNNETATKAAFVGRQYFKTGDIVSADNQGNYYITDRAKELIKFMGYSVAPAELEGLLLNHPYVKDVAVVGIYDAQRASEVPRAYIVPSTIAAAHGEEGAAKEIVDWLTAKVAHFKRLRGGVRFISEIPKSSAGKILRRQLKDIARRQDSTDFIRAKL